MRLAQLLPPVVVGLGLSAVAQEPALQVDWIQSPYSLTWYGLEYTPRSWTDSELLAVSIGGHLGTIRSQAEQDWVGQQFLWHDPKKWSSPNESQVRRRVVPLEGA